MSKYEHGLITLVDFDRDRPAGEYPTTQCAHCGGHFPLPRPPSDKSPLGIASRIGRGRCGNCNGFVCGEACSQCIHWEAKLEIAEGTRNPTAVSVPVPVDLIIPNSFPARIRPCAIK